MKDWLAEAYRGLQKQVKLLQQTAYALGWTSIRPMAEEPTVQPDLRTQPPTAGPLKSLTELLSWQADAHPLQSLLKASVPLQQMHQPGSPPDQPRLLVCHDLHGNYHQDALAQGSSDANYYKLTQWSCIDSFVYFSHALVTIPPPGWINAAHRNGVPVLGTFITEWAAGSLLCELMLWTEQSAEAAAMQLANIALYYGFEGWLLNIENPVLRRLIPSLVHFIRVLRKLMHEMVPGSQVIWSVALILCPLCLSL